MKLSWQNALTVSACLTTLILSGCETSPGGRPELATHIPAACEKLAVRVAHPRYKKGTDVRIVLAKYAAVGGALDQANEGWMQFASAAGCSVNSSGQERVLKRGYRQRRGAWNFYSLENYNDRTFIRKRVRFATAISP